jgi:hypothetical protein
MERVKRLFNAWRSGESAQGDAPPPDPAGAFRSAGPGETLVELVEAESGGIRVGIVKDTAGVYRLYAERWALDWELTHEAAWSPYEPLARTGKSLARARTIAHDWLAARGDAPAGPVEE